MPYLKFISDADLLTAIGKVITIIANEKKVAEKRIHRSVIDPFSALFDGVTQSIPYQTWLKQEQLRQSQKTMQNAIGKFHQDILGSIPGWTNLNTGSVVDLTNEKLRIIAEVKNKFNTTKGNHKIAIYDDLEDQLKKPEMKRYIAYYVEVIPMRRKRYNKAFTPSDNKTKINRPLNNRIRVIDGWSFYSIATGREGALQELFEVLPNVITENFSYKLSKEEAQKYFELFKMAFEVV